MPTIVQHRRYTDRVNTALEDAPPMEPGEWMMGTYYRIGFGLLSEVWVTCPECGKLGNARECHVRADDNVMSPNLVCACGFSWWPQLDGFRLSDATLMNG